MRLVKFKVENHSRVEDFEIDVRGHLVLVGPNDVGKSSILRAMDLLLGASPAQLYARLSSSDFADTAKPLVLEAQLQQFLESEKALFPDEITVDPAGGPATLKVRLEAVIDENETLSVTREAPAGGTGRQISRAQVGGIGWRTISAIASARDLKEDRNTSLDDILSSIDLGTEEAEFERLTQELASRLAESTVLGDLRTELAAQLSKALPNPLEKADLSFVPGASADKDVLSDVRLQVRRDGSLRNLTEQSDGTRALFAIAMYDLVSASANMVGIDEPEMHLHPTSQRSLARLLQTGTNQKLIATHSPDIVGAFNPEFIVTIKPGGRVVQPKVNFLSGEERMVVRWWVRDKLEPLTASRVIFVEGPSDRILLQRAAEVTGRELDRMGVSVVETGGAGDMGAIVKLFGDNGFRIDRSMLIDEDAVDDVAEKTGIDKSDFCNKSIWVSQPDLEAEYVAALGAAQVWGAVAASGLFTPNELASCATSGATGGRTDDDVAAFCRRKRNYKVRAAMAVADLLSSVTAATITSIENLLGEIVWP
ncbi:ATP-dependent nuclease [Mycobacterium seoulense]|uniref:ATP-dependent nuclease n=1 Tax=Mycobacterium seoulense TaxID=386911 RepID=UPI003CF6A170